MTLDFAPPLLASLAAGDRIACVILNLRAETVGAWKGMCTGIVAEWKVMPSTVRQVWHEPLPHHRATIVCEDDAPHSNPPTVAEFTRSRPWDPTDYWYAFGLYKRDNIGNAVSVIGYERDLETLKLMVWEHATKLRRDKIRNDQYLLDRLIDAKP